MPRDVDGIEMARAGVAVGGQDMVEGIQEVDVVVFVGRGHIILLVFLDVAHGRPLVDADGLPWRRHLVIYAVG